MVSVCQHEDLLVDRFRFSHYDGLAPPFQLERDKSISFLKSGMASQNEKFNRLIEQIEKVSL